MLKPMCSRIRNAAAVLAPALLILGLMGLPPASSREPGMAELWNGAEIAWREVGPGIREASQTGKTVVMLFHASWCTSCKRYREVWKDPGVVAASKDLVMILVDVDSDPGANGAFSPDGTYVPRTIFYSPEGDVIEALRGKDPEYPHTIDLDDPAELRGLMEKAAQGGTEQPKPEKRAEN